jgi:DNA modification methylase
MDYIDRILLGNSSDLLEKLPEESIQTCITSPPYFNLRAYDGDPKIFDVGPPTAEKEKKTDCSHKWTKAPPFTTKTGKQGSTETTKNLKLVKSMGKPEPGMFCVHCDAFFGFLGLEPTPELYIKHLVQIFRAVWRVLRKDGTLWVNIADSYASSPGGYWKSGDCFDKEYRKYQHGTRQKRQLSGYKPKDLIGIPHMLVTALRNDGWWWRSTVIWYRSNAMPDSAKDRPTTDFEYVFLLAKNGAKPSFWTHRDGYGSRTKPKPDYRWKDMLVGDEVETEPVGDWRTEVFADPDMVVTHRRWKRFNLWRGHAYYYDNESIKEPAVRSGDIQTFGSEKGRQYTPEASDPNFRNGNEQWGREVAVGATRNKRCVWDIPTKGFPGAHFAVFPETFVEPMILAGSSEKACPVCGAAFLPRKEKVGEFQRRWGKGNQDGSPYRNQGSMQAIYADKGLQPTCACPENDGSGASIVLDPFSGSGTTCMVAKQKHRHWVGMDASQKYVTMSEKRVGDAEPEEDPDANQMKLDL